MFVRVSWLQLAHLSDVTVVGQAVTKLIVLPTPSTTSDSEALTQQVLLGCIEELSHLESFLKL